MTDKTKRIEYAPNYVNTCTGVLSVILGENEYVHWNIDYSTGNPIVMGYTVIIN